jgi:hypothetical protein
MKDRPNSIPDVMEYRPNSRPERTVDIGPDFFTILFTENYDTIRVINVWNGPRYITYNTKLHGYNHP